MANFMLYTFYHNFENTNNLIYQKLEFTLAWVNHMICKFYLKLLKGRHWKLCWENSIYKSNQTK